MISMGIDQSTTSTGIFILDDDGIIFHTVVGSSPKVGDIHLRVWLIVQKITEIAITHKPDIICLEGLSMGSRTGHLGDLGGLQHSIVMSLRFINNFNINIVVPTVLKKFAFGKGNATKWDMVESCPDHIQELLVEYYKFPSYGVKSPSGSGFDVCDAFHLSNYGLFLSNN